MKTLSRVRMALAVAAALGGTQATFGQTLAERVPADAVVYFGWRGTADPGPGYAGSRWAAALKESNFGKLIDDTLPAVGAAVQKKYPEHGALFRDAIVLAQQAIKRPSALFLSFRDGRPQWGIYVRSVDNAKQLTATLQRIADASPSQFSARVVTRENDVGLLYGFASAEDAAAGGLDQDAAFKAGLKQMVADPTSVLFVNVRAVRELATAAVEKNAPPENVERYRKFMAASGLDGVNAYTSAAGFADREWVIDAFLNAPSPRKGLIDVATAKPIDAALVKRVPASSNTVRVFHLDAAGILNDVREISAAVDPAARDVVEKVIGATKLAVGRDLTADLLPSLGTQWAVYTSSDVGGTGGTGMVAVNHLTNPTKAKQAMVALSLFLSNSGRNLVPDKSITLAGRMIRAGDLNVYYTATPLISPAWTIKDDYLYVGFYPQPVIEAARYAGASIDTVPGFAAIAKPTGGHEPLAVTYTDVARTIDGGYESALTASRLLFGLSDMYLAPTPEPLVPSLPALRAQATPATSSIWADDSGLHVRARSPFPGAETMATLQGSSVAAAPLAISVLLPSLNRAREAANRIKSSSNLRQIGLASMMYANENRDNLPPDFATLLRTQEINPDVFVSPRTGSGLPPMPPGGKPNEFYGPWANDASDYVYVGRGRKTVDMAADKILAYEKPHGLEDGINVLFADGHVEFVGFGQVDAVFTAAGLTVPER